MRLRMELFLVLEAEGLYALKPHLHRASQCQTMAPGFSNDFGVSSDGVRVELAV